MKIDFKKSGGLVPAVVQDANTGKVLMLAYMNQEALDKTREIGKVTFFSRSKQRLWTKGETSGNYLQLKEIFVDCDGDTLLVKAVPVGPVCHTGSDTCFTEKNQVTEGFLSYLENLIAERKIHPQEGSYTNSLFAKGLNRIAQKVGEEATEVIIAAKDDDLQLLKEETADLFYHLIVLLQEKKVSLRDVIEVLQGRHVKR